MTDDTGQIGIRWLFLTSVSEIRGENKMNDKLKIVQDAQLKEGIPEFQVGDTIRVHVRIIEEGKTRTQAFEGIVIARRSSGPSETFTVRKISYGEGVERVFPLHSPNIGKMEIIKKGKVRQAKLFYLRKKTKRK